MNARILAAAAVATLLAACGSSTSGGTAQMSVRLVDAPSPGYLEVNVDVRTVEIHGDAGWVTLGSPNRVVNLLALTGGVSETLVDGATLPSGHYGQMRLLLGPANTVKLLDGTVAPLKVPSGMQSGVKLTVSFDVQPGTTADVFLDFDAHRSIFVHEAGASGKYMLRPTVRAYDRMVTGSISGTLTDAGTTLGLPGVVVTAQTTGTSGPAVARETLTDATGHYVLDLLPRDATYVVVSQPVLREAAGVATSSYAPKASAPTAITGSAPTATWSAAFSVAAATGTVTGAVTPVATESQGDVVQARLSLDAGGTATTLIVRTTAASVVGAAESYAFDALPVSGTSTDYGVAAQRVTTDSTGGVVSTVLSPVVTATVPAGGAATADLAF